MAHEEMAGFGETYLIAIGFIVLLGIGFWWLYNNMKKIAR